MGSSFVNHMIMKFKCTNPHCGIEADGGVENRYCGFCSAPLEEIKEEK